MKSYIYWVLQRFFETMVETCFDYTEFRWCPIHLGRSFFDFLNRILKMRHENICAKNGENAISSKRVLYRVSKIIVLRNGESALTFTTPNFVYNVTFQYKYVKKFREV